MRQKITLNLFLFLNILKITGSEKFRYKLLGSWAFPSNIGYKNRITAKQLRPKVTLTIKIILSNVQNIRYMLQRPFCNDSVKVYM